VPTKLAKLLKKMLEVNPEKRFSIMQVLDDEFFKDMEKNA